MKDAYETKKSLLHNNRIHEENEVTIDIAENALVIFEGLGLLSPETSMFGYIRGQVILDTAVNVDVEVPIKSPENDEVVVLRYSIPNQGGCRVEDLCSIESTTPSTLLMLRSIIRSLEALQGSVESRIAVVRMRLLCLHLVLHSRLAHERIIHFFGKDSTLLSDLLSLADKTSEPATELMFPMPSNLATLATEIITFLIDVNGFRRSESNLVNRTTNICDALGLVHNGSTVAVSHAPPWMAILQSCCTNATANGDVGIIPICNDDVNTLPTLVEEARYVRSGLRLFAMCLGLQDHIFPNRESSPLGDASSVGPLVRVLQASVASIERVMTDGESSPIVQEWVWTICRLLSTLELCTGISGFRECDTLGSLAQLLGSVANHFTPSCSAIGKYLLERSLGLLTTSVSASRRGAVNPMEWGVAILYQQYFGIIAGSILRSDLAQGKMLWFSLIELLAYAINAEPAYLSFYLSSEHSNILLSMLKSFSNSKNDSPNRDLNSIYSSSDGYVLFLPLMKFLLAVSITNDGVNFAVETGIAQQILSAVASPCFLIPQSQGIPSEVLKRIGKYLGQIIREIPILKRQIHESARSVVLHCCYDAIKAKATNSETNGEYDTPRARALQRLTNICTVVENLGTSEGRRSSSEFLRDLLNTDVLDGLFNAYGCSLPLPSQMYAQLSLVQNGSMVHFGSHAAAKAVTSLIKLGVGYTQSMILSTAMKCIENKLTTLSAQKRELRGFFRERDALEEDQSSGIRKRRNRGSSYDASSANVFVLGVLDCFPDLRETYDVVRSKIRETSADLEILCWGFLTSLLELEWFSLMLSQCLRSPLRQAGPSPIGNYKDSIRRIFAFYRSSMLEVSRINSQTWDSKVLLVNADNSVLTSAYYSHLKSRVQNADIWTFWSRLTAVSLQIEFPRDALCLGWSVNLEL